jgi:hypothetical protein
VVIVANSTHPGSSAGFEVTIGRISLSPAQALRWLQVFLPALECAGGFNSLAITACACVGGTQPGCMRGRRPPSGVAAQHLGTLRPGRRTESEALPDETAITPALHCWPNSPKAIPYPESISARHFFSRRSPISFRWRAVNTDSPAALRSENFRRRAQCCLGCVPTAAIVALPRLQPTPPRLRDPLSDITPGISLPQSCSRSVPARRHSPATLRFGA